MIKFPKYGEIKMMLGKIPGQESQLGELTDNVALLMNRILIARDVDSLQCAILAAVLAIRSSANVSNDVRARVIDLLETATVIRGQQLRAVDPYRRYDLS